MNRTSIKRARNLVQRSNERAFTIIMRRIYVAQFDEILERIKDTQRTPLEVDIDSIFNDWSKWDKYLDKRLTPQAVQAIKQGFLFAREQAKLTGTIQYSDKEFQKALNASLSKTKYINDTTRNKVTAAITEFKNTGGTITELTTHLQTQVLPQMSSYAAKRVATTTTTTAMNAGSKAMLLRFEDDLAGQQWFSQKDDKVREGEYDHVDADGMIVGVNEKFYVGGEWLEYPGDPSGSQGNIINCRCFQIPIKKKK